MVEILVVVGQLFDHGAPAVVEMRHDRIKLCVAGQVSSGHRPPIRDRRHPRSVCRAASVARRVYQGAEKNLTAHVRVPRAVGIARSGPLLDQVCDYVSSWIPCQYCRDPCTGLGTNTSCVSISQM